MWKYGHKDEHKEGILYVEVWAQGVGTKISAKRGDMVAIVYARRDDAIDEMKDRQ